MNKQCANGTLVIDPQVMRVRDYASFYLVQGRDRE